MNDGSTDETWKIIKELAFSDAHFIGISQSRNRGHQNAVLAGLMEAIELCDITISIDCDGQDDIDAIDEMLACYTTGAEVVYGVRSSRKKDSFFKRFTAQSFYKLLNAMGAEVVYNHADYRLLSNKVLKEFSKFEEVNLFLRGLIPLVGFKSAKVYYVRTERLAGKTHYPLSKMLKLAIDGITSLSIKPIRLITTFGFILSAVSFLYVLFIVVSKISGLVKSTPGFSTIVSVICLIGGVQILGLGIIGEYIGKIYLETKRRPRFIISERTYEKT